MSEMIVVFAHWCPTCNMMMPIAKEVAEDYRERLKVEWIDVEKHPDVLKIYQIQIIPTFIIRSALLLRTPLSTISLMRSG